MANTSNPFIANALIGKRLRAIKGARHAHKTIRASGRVCCAEALAAKMANYRKRLAAKALVSQGRAEYVDPSA